MDKLLAFPWWLGVGIAGMAWLFFAGAGSWERMNPAATPAKPPRDSRFEESTLAANKNEPEIQFTAEPLNAADFTFAHENLQKLFLQFDTITHRRYPQFWNYYQDTTPGRNAQFARHFGASKATQAVSYRHANNAVDQLDLYLTHASSDPHLITSLDFTRERNQPTEAWFAVVSFKTQGATETDDLQVQFWQHNMLNHSFPGHRVVGKLIAECFELRYEAAVDIQPGEVLDYTHFQNAESFLRLLLQWEDRLESRVREVHAAGKLLVGASLDVKCANGNGDDSRYGNSQALTPDDHQALFKKALADVEANRQHIRESYQHMYGAFLEAFPEWEILLQREVNPMEQPK